MWRVTKNKKAKMEWEYIAAVVLILLLVVVILILTGVIKTTILEKAKDVFADFIGKIGRP